MFKEFKEFAFKGNVIDLAIGIVIGAAFGAIVKSFVDNLINPIVGALLGKTDLSNMYFAIPMGDYQSIAAAKASGAAVFAYGAFLTAVINFLIIALVLFLVVKAVNRFREQAEEIAMHECPYCTTEIPKAATRCPACTSEVAAEA